MITQTPQERAAALQPTLIEHAQPSLIEEIAEETKLRGALGMFDLDRAADQAIQRVRALEVLRHAAITSTKPIHWQLFRNEQGQIFARFNRAGADRIAFVFGITVSPKGPVKIVTTHGKRRTAEVYGSATSVVLGMTIDNIRSYRVEGEDFLGRPMEDVPSKFPGGKPRVGVGDNDWIQSTATGLISKGVRLLSGLVTASVEELAEAWDMEPAEVEKKCGMGHGFTKDERKGAASSGQPASDASGQTASDGPVPYPNEGQVKRAFALAYTRIKALMEKEPAHPNVPAKDIVTECVTAHAPKAGGDVAKIGTKAEYDAVCAAIEKWSFSVPSNGGTA